LPKPQGQQQKLVPSPLREREERQPHQPRTQQAGSIDSDSRPMCKAHLAPQHHPFGGGHAKDVPNGQEGDTAPRYAPWAQAEMGKKPIATGILRGPITAEGCGRMAEFLARAPWDEHRDRLITTQSELEKHLNSHNLICRRLTEMLERLPTEAIPVAESKILQQVHRILQNSMLLSWQQEWLRPRPAQQGLRTSSARLHSFSRSAWDSCSR